MKGKIIDFRLRPPTVLYKGFFPEGIVRFANFRFEVDTPDSYEKSLENDAGAEDPQALELLYKEIDNAGIRYGVMNGRHSHLLGLSCHVSDEYIAEMARQSGDRLLGLAGVDGSKPVTETVADIDTAIGQLGLKGLCIEPGLFEKPLYADDETLMPIYEKCDQLEAPILFMTGPFAGPDLTYTHPVQFQHVAETFPDLPIVLGHGAYPYVNEAIGVALKCSAIGSGGVFLSPDVYVFAAGGELYVKGIQWLPDRFLFASAYPFGNCEQLVERTLALPLDEEAMARYLYENAVDLLQL